MRKRKFTAMALAFSRDYPAVSKHRRAITSAVISLGLLSLATMSSSVLFSYPVGCVIPSYFRSADRTSHLDSPFSWGGAHLHEVDHDDKSDLGSKEANKLGQNRKSLDALMPLDNGSVPSDSRSDEKVISRPLSSQDDHPTDHWENDIAPASRETSVDSECDLYHGQWCYDSAGPLYTNFSCPIITQSQNCQGNGRPDKEYENWRWKPFHCDLPRFNATKFLELMSGKTITFVGDSVARNQMESLLCILWQVEVPIYQGNRRMQRWLFTSKSVAIIRVWSAWLVDTSKTLSYVPEQVEQVHLDVPDEAFMQLIPSSAVVVLSNGHWFTKPSAYILNNEIVGTQLWSPPEELHRPMNISNTEAFQISTETSLTAMVAHFNYSGLTIVTSYSPDHYENGAWNTGGSCTGKVRPLLPGQVVEHEYTNTMHDKQVTGFNQTMKKLANGSKLKLMDITEAFGYRHDGHPGPYRSLDPSKITKRGPNGRPPPQDCLHWCMPGPVDVWNELMLEIIRREFKADHQNAAV